MANWPVSVAKSVLLFCYFFGIGGGDSSLVLILIPSVNNELINTSSPGR
jgi:hypothetical protein